MGPLTAQGLTVGVLVLAGCIYWLRFRRGDVAAPPALAFDETEFRAGIAALPDASDATTAMATTAQELFKTFRESHQLLDAKASTLLGFVGGGTSALALLAGADKIVRPAFTPLLIFGVVAVAMVFYFSLQCLVPRTRKSVNVEQLCDLRLLRSSSGKARVTALVGLEYLLAARNLVPIVAAKARFLERAYTVFALGVLAVVANAFFPVQSASQQKTVTIPVTCDFAGRGPFHCKLTVLEGTP